MDVKELQRVQEEYDKTIWEKNLKGTDFEKLRHITFHLTKKLGTLASYCEEKEHGKEVSFEDIKEKITPDFLLHALQLANMFGFDLEKEYFDRLERNKKKFN